MFALLSSGTAEMKHLMVLLEETKGPALLENMGLGSLFFSKEGKFGSSTILF